MRMVMQLLVIDGLTAATDEAKQATHSSPRPQVTPAHVAGTFCGRDRPSSAYTQTTGLTSVHGPDRQSGFELHNLPVVMGGVEGVVCLVSRK